MAARRVFSIVVPVYQNVLNLDDTVPRLAALAERLPELDLELVFVDDGSTDGSYEKLLAHRRERPRLVRLVRLTKNFGQIPAIQAGLGVARGDCIGIISADLQDPCELFVEMVRIWETGTKLVIAERERRDEGLVQRAVSGLYWRLVNRFAVMDYPVGGYDFCVIDRQVAREVVRIGEKNSHIFVLFFHLGFRHEIVRYERRQRVAGRSRWTLSKKLKLLTDTFISFSYVPIRFMTFFGLAVSVLSVILALYVASYRFIFGNPVEGWTTIVVLLCVFGGLILFALGIIGEYQWRILEEARKRPGFVIDTVLGPEDGPAGEGAAGGRSAVAPAVEPREHAGPLAREQLLRGGE